MKVTSITLGNFKNKATLSYDVGNTPGTFSWTPTEDASDKSYMLTINNGLLKDVNLKTITTTYQPISTDNASLMLLPQGIDDSDEIKVTVEYQVTGNIQDPNDNSPTKPDNKYFDRRATLLDKYTSFHFGRLNIDLHGRVMATTNN